MSRIQWSLFEDGSKPAPAVPEPGRLRACASCDQIEAPADPKLCALGLWHCRLDGVATFRSKQTAEGALRLCDKGKRDADE
jgi:hypothetical protein